MSSGSTASELLTSDNDTYFDDVDVDVDDDDSKINDSATNSALNFDSGSDSETLQSFDTLRQRDLDRYYISTEF